MKRRVSLLLAILILISVFSACGKSDSISLGLDKTLDVIASKCLLSFAPRQDFIVKKYFNSEFHRENINYADMAYEHYEFKRFYALTSKIYNLSKNGGSEQEFEEADRAARRELDYIYTLYTLIELRYNRDPSDLYTSRELSYSNDLWDDVYDEYFDALSAMATSPYSHLMLISYSDSEIKELADIGSDDDSDYSSSSLERALLSEYYSLIGENDPDYERICQIFVQLVNLNNNTARSAGYDSFADYSYDLHYARNYSPEDGVKIWELTKQYFVPIMSKYENTFYSSMGKLRRSYGTNTSSEDVLNALRLISERLSPEALDAFNFFERNGLYDIDALDTKVQTSYTVPLFYYNVPFIFHSTDGTLLDILVMTHEFGHYINAYFVQSDLVYGISDNDLCELQSQGLEMISTEFYDEIFAGAAYDALKYTLLNMTCSVVDGAMYDEFLQRVYSEEGLTEEKVLEIYKEVYVQYGYSPYSGYEYEWTGVPHNFESPFYYISYCVSAIPALEIYAQIQESPETANDTLMKVLAMNTEEYYFSDALEDAKLSDAFSAEAFIKSANAVQAGLDAAFAGNYYQ